MILTESKSQTFVATLPTLILKLKRFKLKHKNTLDPLEKRCCDWWRCSWSVTAFGSSRLQNNYLYLFHHDGLVGIDFSSLCLRTVGRISRGLHHFRFFPEWEQDRKKSKWRFTCLVWAGSSRSSARFYLNPGELTRRSCAPARGCRTCNHRNRRHLRRRPWCCAASRAGPLAPSGLGSSLSDKPEGEKTHTGFIWRKTAKTERNR